MLLSSNAFCHEVFKFTKSFRPKNVLHFSVNTKDCRIADKSPIINYWIMGEEKGQKEGLTKDEKKLFTPEIIRENGHELEFIIGEMGELCEDPIIKSPILVRMIDCKPKAFIRINGEDIELKEIYADISLLRQKIKYLVITGKRPNGKLIKHRIDI